MEGDSIVAADDSFILAFCTMVGRVRICISSMLPDPAQMRSQVVLSLSIATRSSWSEMNQLINGWSSSFMSNNLFRWEEGASPAASYLVLVSFALAWF